jgi:pilus assembly protein FimV
MAAAGLAAKPRPTGPGQGTYDDHLPAELSDLRDLDLEDADIKMPELVTGAGNSWEAADEADLSFELDLTARSATDDGPMSGDAAVDGSISLNTADLDDRLLDLEDSRGWDVVERDDGRPGVPDTEDLQVEELNAALGILSGERDGEAERITNAVDGRVDAHDPADQDAEELDLLTETVIMDGLEFGTGLSPAPTASLSTTDGGSTTKLDLARAYLDMGDVDGARTMLDEVLQEGTEAQRREAEVLAARIGRVSNL